MATHTHLEGVAGAIAVAVAAGMAWQLRLSQEVTEITEGEAAMKGDDDSSRAERFFGEVLRLTPESRVRRGILIASQTPAGVPPAEVAKALGNGSQVTAPDTVPFCLWMAAHHLDRFVPALSQTIAVGGDCDTNAAIVGGIVALSAGREAIPAEWLKARESFNTWPEPS